MNPSNLEALGWDSWFAEQAMVHGDSPATVARVASVDRDQLLLLNARGAFRAKLAGKALYAASSAAELPCVGDWVRVIKAEADQFGLVQGIFERKTSLRRKAAGESVEYQMIAANVDVVIIVQSCHYDFNLKRLERYLVMVREGAAIPTILLTKTDLVDADTLAAQLAQITRAGITAPVLTLSNVTQAGIADLKAVLAPGKTYCFVGSSGVGKSTLINGLVGQEVLATRGVSGSGEGRHTTVRRELILLENGAMVIDNPGMREFGLLGAESGIEQSYADIAAIASQCHFSDCRHSNEPGCAVLAALAAGKMAAEHYANFLKLRSESAYHQLSYAEKRKKDKDFGRFIKGVKKDRADD